MTQRRIRALVLLVILAVWAVYTVSTIWTGHIPDATTWGVPAAAYAVLYQPWRKDPPEGKT